MCSAGRCICGPTHTGHDCAIANGLLKDESKVLAQVKHSFWQFYLWDAATPVDEWVLHFSSLHLLAGPTSTSHPELYLAWDRTPSLEDWDIRAVDLASYAAYNVSYRDVPANVQQLPSEPGLWVLGVYAYCCADARVELLLSLPQLTTTSTTAAMEHTTSQQDIGPTTTPTAQDLGTAAVDDDVGVPTAGTPAPVDTSAPAEQVAVTEAATAQLLQTAVPQSQATSSADGMTSAEGTPPPSLASDSQNTTTAPAPSVVRVTRSGEPHVFLRVPCETRS